MAIKIGKSKYKLTVYHFSILKYVRSILSTPLATAYDNADSPFSPTTLKSAPFWMSNSAAVSKPKQIEIVFLF